MDHPHQLELKPPGAPYMCSGCKELGFASSYHCENKSCGYVLHEECANPVSHAFHPFFEKSYFEFYEKAPGYRTRYCDACGKDVKGFVYHCTRTGYDLHPCCLKLKYSISDHEKCSFTLNLSQNVPKKCEKCKHRNVVRKVRGWSYVLSSSTSDHGNNKSCYHVSCFKDLILENWKKGYFSNSNSMSGRQSDYQLAVLPSIEMVQRSRRSRIIDNKYTKIAVMVFKLIFSAIFGDPISAIVTLLEALASN